MTFVIRDLLRTSRYVPFLRIERRRAGLLHFEQQVLIHLAEAAALWRRQKAFIMEW
jgi:hypothetical protein